MAVGVVQVLRCGCKVRVERDGLLTRWIKTEACPKHPGAA
jgi:hypothetical protein